MSDKEVLIRIFDTSDQHLVDLRLMKSAALYLSPGAYLGDYAWSEKIGIHGACQRKIRSVGVANEALEGVYPEPAWMSIWVDAVS